MHLLACFCNILAIFHDGFRALANLIDLAADIVYCLLVNTPPPGQKKKEGMKKKRKEQGEKRGGEAKVVKISVC